MARIGQVRADYITLSKTDSFGRGSYSIKANGGYVYIHSRQSVVLSRKCAKLMGCLVHRMFQIRSNPQCIYETEKCVDIYFYI